MFFQRLTEPALKRLYKFVLKRIIGQFLQDELDLDQLNVHLRSGTLELCDLALNIEALNEHLQHLPFIVQSGYLGSVKANISYTNLMNESCRIKIEDVVLIMIPRKTKNTSSTRSSDQHESSSGDIEEFIPQDSTTQEGLEFVSEWIEQITSKIRVTFSNICIKFTEESTSKHNSLPPFTFLGQPSKVTLAFNLKWLEFCDETPVPAAFQATQHMASDGSTPTPSSCATQKSVRFKEFNVELVVSGEKTTRKWILMSTNDGKRKCYVQLKRTLEQVPSWDLDVFLHSISGQLQPQLLQPLVYLFQQFSSFNSSPEKEKNTSGTLPTHNTGVEDSDAFLRIETIFRNHREQNEGEDSDEFFDCHSEHAGISSPETNSILGGIKIHLLSCRFEGLYTNVEECNLPHLISTEQREFIYLEAQDVLLTSVTFPHESTVSLSIGTLQVNECLNPQVSKNGIPEMITAPVLYIGDDTHERSHLKVQLRVVKELVKSTLSVEMWSSPPVIELDMEITKRLDLYLSSSALGNVSQQKKKLPVNLNTTTMRWKTDMVYVNVRFPTVPSDAIRFGPSSSRGLCEDLLKVKISSLCLSTSSTESYATRLQFGSTQVYLVWPANQRSLDCSTHLLVSSTDDINEGDDHNWLQVRGLDPNDTDIQNAIYSDPSHEHYDRKNSDDMEETACDDIDSSRGEDKDLAIGRRIEKTAKIASSFILNGRLMNIKVDFLKGACDRLLHLLDALAVRNAQYYLEKGVGKSSMSFLTINVLADQASFLIRGEKKDMMCSYKIAVETFNLFYVLEWLGKPVARAHASALNMTLFEITNGSTSSPVLYKTSWGRTRGGHTQQPPLLYMMMEISDTSADMRDILLTLCLHGLSLRYDVTSTWLFQLIELLVTEYPPPILPIDTPRMSNEEAHALIANGMDVLPSNFDEPKVFTKLFVNCYDATVDYSPPDLSSRMALVFGKINVSSNLVTGTTMQGFKFLLHDIEVYLTNDREEYGHEDYHMCGGKKKEGNRFLNDIHAFSLQEHLEERGFIHIALLKSADVFLKSCLVEKEKKSSASPPEMSIEVSLGSASVYTCFDTCETIMELMDMWTNTFNALYHKEIIDRGNYVGVKRVKDTQPPGIVSTSIKEAIHDQFRTLETKMLHGIEEDAFKVLPNRITTNSITKPLGDPIVSSLNVANMVIEDYYTLSQQSKDVEENLHGMQQSRDVPKDPWFEPESKAAYHNEASHENTSEDFNARWLEDEQDKVVSTPFFEPVDSEEEDSSESEHIHDSTVLDDSIDSVEVPNWWVPPTADETEMEDMHVAKNDTTGQVKVDFTTRSGSKNESIPILLKQRSSTDVQPRNESVESTWEDIEGKANWFKDEPLEEKDIKIFPHHVEIPVSGGAATLSFGEKEVAYAFKTASTGNDKNDQECDPRIIYHLLLRDFSISWRLFGGHDWAIEDSKSVPREEQKTNQVSSVPAGQKMLLDALLDNYVPSHNAVHELQPNSLPNSTGQWMKSTKLNRPGSGRKTEEMIEITLSGITARVDTFSDTIYDTLRHQPLASNVVLHVKDVEILDCISTSCVRKMVSYWKSESQHPRETGTSMLRCHWMSIRPGPSLCEEHRIKTKLLPLRINLDQEAIDFLNNFFATTNVQKVEKDSVKSLSPQNRHRLQESEIQLGVWFFQSCDIGGVKMKIDYRPHHINYKSLKNGDYLEALNLFILEGMELDLEHLMLSGIDGWGELGNTVLSSWANDIYRHQIHRCVASVSMPPVRSMSNLGSGAADLILLPIEQYARDKRLLKGLQRGAHSFLRTATIETLNISSRIARGTQAILEQTEDVVAPRGRKSDKKKNTKIRTPTKQPSTTREGFSHAYTSMSREIQSAAHTIVAVPMMEYKKTGPHGYAKSVIRAAPVAVLRPMIGATEAISHAIIGMRNQVDPELKEDMENKFKAEW